jgi:hypothetical protein
MKRMLPAAIAAVLALGASGHSASASGYDSGLYAGSEVYIARAHVPVYDCARSACETNIRLRAGSSVYAICWDGGEGWCKVQTRYFKNMFLPRYALDLAYGGHRYGSYYYGKDYSYKQSSYQDCYYKDKYYYKGQYGEGCYDKYEQPYKEYGYKKPYKDYGYKEPYKEYGYKEPYKDYGYKEPYKGYEYKEPYKEYGYKQPYKEYGYKEPYKEYGYKQGAAKDYGYEQSYKREDYYPNDYDGRGNDQGY